MNNARLLILKSKIGEESSNGKKAFKADIRVGGEYSAIKGRLYRPLGDRDSKSEITLEFEGGKTEAWVGLKDFLSEGN